MALGMNQTQPSECGSLGAAPSPSRHSSLLLDLPLTIFCILFYFLIFLIFNFSSFFLKFFYCIFFQCQLVPLYFPPHRNRHTVVAAFTFNKEERKFLPELVEVLLGARLTENTAAEV